MKFNLNGEEIEINKFDFGEFLTIEGLIELYQLDVKKIAVEKNMEIVPRSRFSEAEVAEGDNIEIIHFIGGG